MTTRSGKPARKAATKRPRYCKRHRKMHLVGGHNSDGTVIPGEVVSALITRYRFGAKRRKPHYVYWYAGTWYRAYNAATELDDTGKPRAWEWVLVPITHASAWDAYQTQTLLDGKAAPVRLSIANGKAKAVGIKGTPWEGVELLSGDEPADYVADLLDLDRPEYVGRHFKVA